MSGAKILIRAPPNVEYVHGFPGIPPGPDRPPAAIRGTVEIRLGQQPVKAKYVKVELRKIETIPSGNRSEEFRDLVGQSPETVWEAKDDSDMLSTGDFAFDIRVPETIPPSVALERGAGIKYEIVATLCTKGKRGLFRREGSTPISCSVPVVIDKHELHSTWPVYAQPESRQVINNGLVLVVDRSNTCFAPGDRVAVFVTLKSDNLTPIVLRGFEFSLRETITYRGNPQSHSKKNGPLRQTSLLGEQKLPVSMTIYGGTQHRAELACLIPGTHTTSSVNAGRHIDIGYTLNIKAIIDMANPVVMDLPVTISNWPRHVSAEMMRRIGTAPNLTLLPTTSPRTVTSLPQTMEPRSKYGPPPPPPSGGLPSLPSGNGTSRSVPPGALLSGPPGSPNQYSASMNPYSFQQNPYSTAVRQASPQLRAAPAPEATITAGSDALAVKNPGNPDEFGRTRQPVDIVDTVPSRLGEKPDFGLSDADQRAATANSRSTVSQSSKDLDRSGSSRVSQYSQDSDVRANVISSPPSSTGRRARGMSRTLKIMNVNDDIPEEESPVKMEAPRPFDTTSPALPQTAPKPTSPLGSSFAPSPWPTSDEEKQRLYEKAQARAQKAQATAKAADEVLSQTRSPQPSNGHVSPPRQASPTTIGQSGGERPKTTSRSLSQTPWPTAEEEKQTLFERAQAKVRQTRGLVDSPPPSSPQATPSSTPSPAAGSTQRPSHQRTPSSNSSSSQDLQSNRGFGPYTSTSVATMSPGAALYSHAMASINRSASSASTPVPRRNASYAGSGTTVSASSPPPPTRQVVSIADDKSALRYYEAKNAVQRQQLAGSSISDAPPQEDPIPYEELFGSRSSSAPPSGPSTNGTSAQLSEKELISRAYKARDAAAAAPRTPPPAAVPTPVPTAVTAHRSPSVRTTTHPTGPSTRLSEKEVLRRAFEARDAAILRSGQTPPPQSPILVPFQPTPPPVPYPPHIAATSSQPTRSDIPPLHPSPARSSSIRTSPSPSDSHPPSRAPPSEKEQMRLAFEARDRAINGQPTSRAPLSEKEQMKLAFEARDRALEAQQSRPPDYDIPSLPPVLEPPAPVPQPTVRGASSGSPLSANVQLNARYSTLEADAEIPSPEEEMSKSPYSEGLDPHSSLKRAPSHRSHRSDTSETFLRRDPSISAGKKRASQIQPTSPPPPPPPPLPPRPPAEYIEETKLEDRRNTMIASVTIPPSDFSTPFDLGFDLFSTEPTSHDLN